MAEYHYSALDRDGQTVTGVVPAESRNGAIAALADRGIFVVSLKERSGARDGAPTTFWRLTRTRRVSLRARSAMLQQLATALKAGLPLLPSLRVVEEQADTPAMRALLGDVAQRVQGGEPLSGAMEAHPREFSRLEVSMARVGETAGLLDEVMAHLAEFADRDIDIREKIRSAATYPIFVLVLALFSVVIILTFILPRVMGSVAENSTTLPAPTRVLMGISSLLKSYGWLLCLGLVGAGLGFRGWVRRPEGRLAFDRFKLRVPVLGEALRRIAVARFARTLGTLSRSGIQILEALHVLRDTLGNEALAQQVDKVSASITQGQSIAEPLRQTGQFPPLLIQVIAMGEKTGKLDELLLQTAGAYEKDTAAAIQRVMTILPALFIVGLALVVAFILAAVLLPIINMETAVPGM